MERLLARLERRFGNFAIENIAAILIGGMALVFLMGMLKPGFASALALSPFAITHGQPWRLVTFLFVPPDGHPLLLIFVLMFAWTVLTSLEGEWGAFRLNVFYLIGMLGTIAAAFITGRAVGNDYLNASCLLAFGTLFPDYEIRLMLLIPVRMKWMALLLGGYYVFQVLVGDWGTRAAVIAAFANYLLFFGDRLAYAWRSRDLHARAAAKSVSTRPRPEVSSVRVCAICGKREDDGADIRLCSCDTCKATGGPRNLCLEHARNH